MKKKLDAINVRYPLPKALAGASAARKPNTDFGKYKRNDASIHGYLE